MSNKIYPIGIQNFEKIRKGYNLYPKVRQRLTLI